MTYPRRKRSRWTEGGRTFQRRGMVIHEVRRCHGCGGWHQATEPQPCGVVVAFRNRKGEAK